MTPNEYAADMEDALAKAAGYYATPDEDTEHVYPPAKWSHPHAARPGHMPNVQDLVAENARLRALLRALVQADPIESLVCIHCRIYVLPLIGLHHEADCPWRLAKEYLAEREAKGE